MKRLHLKRKWTSLALAAMTLSASMLYSCEPEDAPTPDQGGGSGGPIENPAETPIETPFTSIPDALVGTWFASDNDGPLTTNWEKGTFQGQQGFKEFRTMVFTKNGKEAVEYTTDVVNFGGETKQYFYKISGTLEYATNPASLTFHAQTGTMRVFSDKYAGYKEAPIIQKDLLNYYSVLRDPEATTYSSSTNYLNAKRFDGGNHYSVKYEKVDGNTTPVDPNSGGLYTTPPATGTYVQVENLYYPTVTIGEQEWMSVNYAGPGGIQDTDKPQYGTFFKFADLPNIPVPAGWCIPTKGDYTKLLESQGLVLDEWGKTDGADVGQKRLIGQLMATAGWLKQDGYANNQSGFNAVPANLRVIEGNPHGEGANCLLWTSEKDEEDNPIVFEIIQFPSDTFAGFTTYSVGYNPPHIPVRLVRDK